MGTKTGISWTDATWNPIRGCSRVSEGCRNCYAEKVAYRFSAAGLAYEGLVQLDMHKSGMIVRLPKWNGKIKFVEEHLLDPLRWKKPRRIFVNSMSDLFHENVTDEMRDKIFAVMALCPQHTFQVLTKRPERMRGYMNGHGNSHRRNIPVYNAAVEICAGDFSRMSQQMGRHRSSGEGWWPLPNVQLGVSGEDQETVTKRCWMLLQTPAAVRFLSLEPMLGSVDLNAGELICKTWRKGATIGIYLDWVIVGGESGPGARPMHPEWARSVRDQCRAAGVPFFFKQWGEWTPGENVEATSGIVRTADWFNGHWSFDKENLANDEGHVDDQPDVYRIGTKASGCLLDGVEHHEFPAVTA